MASRHGLAIRAADGGDVDGLTALLAAAGMTISKDRLASRLSGMQDQPGVLLLAEEWGPPSGLIAVHWHAGLTADLKIAAISTLLVDPERRRNGVARILLKAASQAARAAGCGELLLSCEREAHDLSSFCLATGFTAAGSTFARPLRKRGSGETSHGL